MRNLAVVLVAAALGGACSAPRDHSPSIRALYGGVAMREARNPVVVVHGILGARLEERETRRTVWGAFTADALDPSTPAGARALALPFDDVAPGAMPDLAAAAVFPTGPLEAIKVGLVFTVVNVGVYVDILRTLGVGGYVDPVLLDPASPEYAEDHFSCFTFFYDWRRDCATNAAAFDRFLAETRARIDVSARRRVAELRADGSPAAIGQALELEHWLEQGYRFDVVAHSMGGLVARYYLRYGAEALPAEGPLPAPTWKGAEQIDRLVLVGTPNLGSMEALQNLIEGFSPGLLLPTYDAAILGTMTSIYQLMPRGDGLVLDEDGAVTDVDLFDVDVWDRNGWGLLAPAADEKLRWLLPDVDDRAERRRRARDVVAANLDRARRFHLAIDTPADGCPVDLRLFAADTEPTLARVRMRRDGDRLVPSFSGDDLRKFGDGTVTRRSALGDRRVPVGGATWLESAVDWAGVTFLPDDHIGLTSNPVFTDNVLFHLLEHRPRRRAR